MDIINSKKTLYVGYIMKCLTQDRVIYISIEAVTAAKDSHCDFLRFSASKMKLNKSI